MSSSWWIYFVRCRGGEIYTGICTDVGRRFIEHQNGGARAAKYLRGRGPLKLLGSMHVGDRSAALRLEAEVKKLSRAGKKTLIGNPRIMRQRLARLRAPNAQR